MLDCMNVSILAVPDYVNTPVLAYDWMVAAYFFLGGLGAGAFVFAVVAEHWKKSLQPLARVPALVSPVALTVGLLILLLDLGQPFRAYKLFTSFQPTSALSWGVWFLNIFFALSVLHAWCLLKGRAELAKKVGIAGIPFAILVAMYTGVLLTQAPGRPLWHSALVPPLFVNGALVSGIAVAMLASAGKVDRAIRVKLGRVLAGLVALELAFIAVELISLFYAGGESAAVARGLMSGTFGFLFLGVEVGLGVVLPVCILMRSKGSAAAQSVAAALVLLGVLTMRFVVVIGGQVIN